MTAPRDGRAWIAPRSGGYTPKDDGKPKAPPPQGRGSASPRDGEDREGYIEWENVMPDYGADSPAHAEDGTSSAGKMIAAQSSSRGETESVVEKATQYIARLRARYDNNSAGLSPLTSAEIAQALADAGLLLDGDPCDVCESLGWQEVARECSARADRAEQRVSELLADCDACVHCEGETLSPDGFCARCKLAELEDDNDALRARLRAVEKLCDDADARLARMQWPPFVRIDDLRVALSDPGASDG